MDFLLPHAATNPDLADWMASHEKVLARAFRAVASIYADDAVLQETKILSMISQADDAWARRGTLSQRAIRTLLSTAGVSTVLVGMRKEAYVDDVLAEIHHPLGQTDRAAAWARLSEAADGLFAR
jgi:aryl-alcohol dehydrogenase-like predicted oxidoreductase